MGEELTRVIEKEKKENSRRKQYIKNKKRRD